MSATILYIEDDPGSRTLVERTLGYAGYRVVCADRGLIGIDLAHRENPDIILVDINLPDLTGREITSMLRAEPRFKHTPIVALTAQSTPEYRDMALAAGMNGYLTKPVDIETLAQRVAFFLSGGHEQIEASAHAAAQKRHAEEMAAALEARIRQLEEANANIRRLDAMKDTFIQLTAHELRTPLTLVYGYYGLMKENRELSELAHHDPGIQALLQGMSTAISRMQTIVNEILTISRIITNQIDLVFAPVMLADVAAHALTLYAQAVHDRQLKVYFHKQDWMERVTADADMLKLVLGNLVSNAIKYTPNGGTVSLRLQRQEETVRIMVQDTGIGIDKANQTTIFERFSAMHSPELHTTSKTAFMGGGLGLGLAICKGIIEAHGGQIWVESAGSDPKALPGSEFILVLPRDGRRAAKRPPAGAPPS